jgi:hypothetical protein
MLVPLSGVEPERLRTSLSDSRVCLFHHSGVESLVEAEGFEPPSTLGLSQPHMPFCYASIGGR